MLSKVFPKRMALLLALYLLVILIFPSATLGREADVFDFDIPDLGLWEQERDDGGYYRIVDQHHNVLDKTIRKIYPGDEFIASDNRHYRIDRVKGDDAFAQVIGSATSAATEPATDTGILPVAKTKGGELIALYHTHSDESYVPSDGSESIPGNGGIYKVGAHLAEKLQEKGIKVSYDETPHDPHDADAYRRSRRTAIELMKKSPAAIIDIHRDGVPDPDFYYNNVSGMDITKVRLVVGRQNQNMNSNLEFAKKIKAQLDKYYPGLVQGIFLAKGNYNQDLSPRSLLIEVGTHTNYREMAEKGAVLFADAIPVVLGIGPQSPPKTASGKIGSGDTKSLWWLLIMLVLGGGGFLLLATGSFKKSLVKLREFPSQELPGVFKGPEQKKDPTRSDENDE